MNKNKNNTQIGEGAGKQAHSSVLGECSWYKSSGEQLNVHMMDPTMSLNKNNRGIPRFIIRGAH